MNNTELIDYINSQLKLGFDEVVLREKILSKGWSQSQVDEAFNQIKNLTNQSFGPKEVTQNTSGLKDATIVPEEIKGWSWAAFLMTWIWAIGNNVWIGLLTLVPTLGFIVQIMLGLKGKEWAWKNKHWESVEQFNTAQKKWVKWGIIFCVVGLLLSVLSGILMLLTVNLKKTSEESTCIEACGETVDSQVCIDGCKLGIEGTSKNRSEDFLNVENDIVKVSIFPSPTVILTQKPTLTLIPTPANLRANGPIIFEDGVSVEVGSANMVDKLLVINVVFKNTSSKVQSINLLHVQLHNKKLGTSNEGGISNTTIQPGEIRNFDLKFQVLPSPPYEIWYFTDKSEHQVLATYNP